MRGIDSVERSFFSAGDVEEVLNSIKCFFNICSTDSCPRIDKKVEFSQIIVQNNKKYPKNPYFNIKLRKVFTYLIIVQICLFIAFFLLFKFFFYYLKNLDNSFPLNVTHSKF